MCKSPNKHNRLTGIGRPLEEGLPDIIEKGETGPNHDPKLRAKYLHDEFGWDKDLAGGKLWNFGPENNGPNCLVDGTKGV